MAETGDNHLGGRDAVEQGIGIGGEHHASRVLATGCLRGVRMILHQGNDGKDAITQAGCALRRTRLDVRKGNINLAKRKGRVSQIQKRYFENTASTSMSVAISPRSISASASIRSASSSGVN